ncbi:ETC complex I subunit [Phyllobacterium leguminum]|uniref:ETC complex I subunit-like protein n=1 Tax=Phyllobacterium leguminum TaxID=314237 RepID=A0A318T949_9HYPH|nr:ETC complex I subunit [Phyllobacterium leguminum]PYE87213.1 ETC complex I subunit-like protein [Phyllobacterium leguminum]
MVARIYRPAKTAMQSGKAKTTEWLLEFEPESPRKVEPLMGYTSSGDMKSQIKLFFGTKEEAVAYAEKNGIPYRLDEPKEAARRKVSYSDNFKYDRQQPWTH